jgi:hypothetical protein
LKGKQMKMALVMLTLTAAVCLMTSGCASGIKFQDAKASIPELNPESGRFYFYRANSPIGAAIQPKIYLNYSVVGKAIPGGFFYLDKEPGNYQIRTSTEVTRTLSITLDPGQTRYVKFDVSIGALVAHVSPILVDTEKAQNQISGCKLAKK